MPALATWDAFAPGLALGHAIGRVGCFAAGCCYGKPTSHFWGVTFTNPIANLNSYTPLGIPLEPTQLFEAAVELANFFILMWLFKRKKFDGQVLAAYLDSVRHRTLFSGIHSRRSGARFGLRRNHDRNPVDFDLPGDYGRIDLVAEVVAPSGSGARPAVGRLITSREIVALPGTSTGGGARAHMPQFPLLISATADDAGKRLDQFLVAHLPETSRARVQQLISQKLVLVNDSAAQSLSSVFAVVSAFLSLVDGTAAPLRAMAEDIPLDIVYEDADLAVVNKPAGMTVHAGAGATEDERNRGTLVNALLHHFGQLSSVGGELRPGIVHRLDKATSGLIGGGQERRSASPAGSPVRRAGRSRKNTSLWYTAG